MTSSVLLLILLGSATAQAVPTGLNPYLYGIHDTPDPGFMPGTGGCARGWVTELLYIGTSGTCGAGDIDRSASAAQGYGHIIRLDANGSPPFPTASADYPGFANAFADCVARASGVYVWIVGNEPNIDWGHVYQPSEIGEIYRQVVDAVRALPGGEAHEILFPAMAPWAYVLPWGDWDDGLAAAIDYVLQHGGEIDGVAIHAYTREFSLGAITSDEWFPGRENKWHLHFRGYRDTTALLAARGLYDIPLYITEAGNACDGNCGNPCDPYPDALLGIGYFQAMYEEIHGWNQANPGQIIRAVTPYRWTSNDDGSCRDFCIGCASDLVTDMQAAMAVGRKWHDSDCHEPFADAGVDAAAPDAAVPADGQAGADGQAPGPDAAGEADGRPPGPDAGDPGDGNASGGCSCRSAGAGDEPLPLVFAGLLLLGLIRRLRRAA